VSSVSASSCTVRSRVPGMAPEALAVIVAVLFPSGKVSSTAVMLKVTKVWFAGIVTVAGTVASVVSLELRLTTRSLVPLVARVTVPMETGFAALSEKDEEVALSVSMIEGAGPKVRPVAPGEPMFKPPDAFADAPSTPAVAAR